MTTHLSEMARQRMRDLLLALLVLFLLTLMIILVPGTA